ncbi:MAG: magnesium-dependent phosphatase-1 [Armatimonadota bacterium]|nr:magnesium-dependent phosphatase-1 [Armatimonadota bacterium]MDR7533176.1 magnesium-dependent phosphatase-1 [Armatimonadota bacterium]MDR7535436.1 magnesium-dependent phosphatase-1 [Armatimonadota bacterium]
MEVVVAVRLVILDCDLTLWNHANVTALRLPFERDGDDAVRDQDGVRVALYPGVRRLLAGLRARKLVVAAASWNRPEPVAQIFALLGLEPYFDLRKVEPHPHKERMVAALVGELAGRGLALRPEEILYVDDRRIHLDAIHASVGPVRFLQMGHDIQRPDEVLGYLDDLGVVPAP